MNTRALVVSALFVAIGALQAEVASAQVTSEGLYRGEQIVNLAKELVADALNFVGDAAQGAVETGKDMLSRIGSNDAIMGALGERGFTFDA